MPEPGDTRIAYAGRWLRVDIESWPGFEPYEVVYQHDAAGVLPVTPAGDVILVKQFRPPVRQVLTEIPAGKLDVEGEDALSCAARELFEETGYRHRTIEFLAGYYSSAGCMGEYVHMFWALTESEPEADPEEGIEVVLVPFERMLAAARSGKIRDVKTAMALLLAPARAFPEPGRSGEAMQP
jgi:ADP-ribose pyrophosphatase